MILVRLFVLGIGCLCMYSSCAPEQKPTVTQAEELPLAAFVNYEHTLVVNSAPEMRIKAGKAEVYSKSDKIVLQSVSFTEYKGDGGSISASGKADMVIFYNQSEDAEFIGGVVINSRTQDVIISGEYFRWTNKEKQIEGKKDGAMTISRGDGSRVSGTGFIAFGKTRSFSFQSGVEGVLQEKALVAPNKADDEIQEIIPSPTSDAK